MAGAFQAGGVAGVASLGAASAASNVGNNPMDQSVDEVALFAAAEQERMQTSRAATTVQKYIRGAKARASSAALSATSATKRAAMGAAMGAPITAALPSSAYVQQNAASAMSKLARPPTLKTARAAGRAVVGTASGAAEFVADNAYSAGALARKLWRAPHLAASDFVQLLERGGGLAEGVLHTLAGTSGGFVQILALGSALKDSADISRRKQYVAVLRYSLDLSLSIVQSALKQDGVVSAISRRIDDELAALHLSGGVPLADEGVLAHYRLELLRHNATQSQALRAVPVYPTIAGRVGKRPVYHYETVRKTNLLEPNLHFPAGKVLHPTDVYEQGFLHDFQLKVMRPQKKPSTTSGAPPRAAGAAGALPVAPVTSAAPVASAAPPLPLGEPAPSVPPSPPSTPTAGRSMVGVASAMKSAAVKSASKKAASTVAATAAVGAKLSGATASALDMAASVVVASGSGGGAGSGGIEKRREPLEQVDAHLEARYPCCSGPMKSWLPPWLKAQLPFEADDGWMPASLRDHADEVVALDIDVEMSLVFDPESGNVEAEACDDVGCQVAKRMGFGRWASPLIGPSVREKVKPPPVRFQLQLTGTGCWPTLAQLTVRSVRFRARCKVWWDVFRQTMLLAFIEAAAPDAVAGGATGRAAAGSGEDGAMSGATAGDAANNGRSGGGDGGGDGGGGGGAPSHGKHTRFDTDLDLSFFGCGMPLPTDVEARLVSNLVTMVMAAHNRLNPYQLDLSEFVGSASESMAASILQAAHRGHRDRKASTMQQVRSNQSNARVLEAQVAQLQDQIAELRAELKEVRQQQSALNLGLRTGAPAARF